MPFWGVVLAWFGFIYLVAFTLAALALVILPTKARRTRVRRRLRLRRIGGLAAAGVIAVGLTAIYSVIVSASGSGMSLSQTVGVQLFHSAIFFTFSILTAVIWQIVQARKAARLAGPRLGSAIA